MSTRRQHSGRHSRNSRQLGPKTRKTSLRERSRGLRYSAFRASHASSSSQRPHKVRCRPSRALRQRRRPICSRSPASLAVCRPLTFIKYNVDGDLLVTCAKDHTPQLWYADDGERIGNFKGHNGAVWTCDVSGSLRFLTLR